MVSEPLPVSETFIMIFCRLKGRTTTRAQIDDHPVVNLKNESGNLHMFVCLEHFM